MPSCLPSTLAPIPPISPHGAQPRPFPLSLPRASPPLYALDATPLAASLSVDHQARPPPSVLPSVKFSSGRARRSGYFVPFCRPITCLPYVLHAAVSARRYTQRKQAYSQSCAPYLPASVSTFYTLKKKFRFLQKKLAKKLAYIKNTYYLCTRKITTNVAYSFFELIVYLYRQNEKTATGCSQLRTA